VVAERQPETCERLQEVKEVPGMDLQLKEDFKGLWKKYFNSAELPITFYYTDEEGHADLVKPGTEARCVMGPIVKVRKGNSLAFNAESIGCFGGKRYLGFSPGLMPDFEYFLSCGIPGKMEGERYKKSPEIVKELLERWPKFTAPGRYVVFKRWDKLEEADDPQVVIFFAKPDVLAGLYTLANFDTADPQAVAAPMGSGCSSIIQNPFLEKDSENPHGIIGMFDLSARPFVAADELTFSVPLKKFNRMVRDMEESFLITDTWKAIQKRIL
jgi:uncharacterized protein (DUF169 family)